MTKGKMIDFNSFKELKETDNFNDHIREFIQTDKMTEACFNMLMEADTLQDREEVALLLVSLVKETASMRVIKEYEEFATQLLKEKQQQDI